MDNRKGKHEEGRQKRHSQVDKMGTAKASGSGPPLFGEPVCIQRDTNDLQKYAKRVLGDYQTVVPRLDNNMLGIETLPSTPVQEGKRNVFDVSFQPPAALHGTSLFPRAQGDSVKKEHHLAKTTSIQSVKRVSSDVRADPKLPAVSQQSATAEIAESGTKQSNVLPSSFGKHKSKPVRPYNPSSPPPSLQNTVPTKAPKLIETDLFKDLAKDAKPKKSKQRSEAARKAPPTQDVKAPPIQDVKAPPTQDVKVPLTQDVKAPPTQDVKAPPTQDVKAPPTQDAKPKPSNSIPQSANSTPTPTQPAVTPSGSVKLKKASSSSSLARTVSNSSLISSSNLSVPPNRPVSSSPAFNHSAAALSSLNPSVPNTPSSKEDRHQEATPIQKPSKVTHGSTLGDVKSKKKKCKKDKEKGVSKHDPDLTASNTVLASSKCTPLPSKAPDPHPSKAPDPHPSKAPTPNPSKAPELLPLKLPEPLVLKASEAPPPKVSEPLPPQAPTEPCVEADNSCKPRPGNLTIGKRESMAAMLAEEVPMDTSDVLTILEEMTKPMLPMVTPIQTPCRKNSGDFTFPSQVVPRPVQMDREAIKTGAVPSIPVCNLINIQHVPAVLSPLSSDSDSESKHAVNHAVVRLDEVLDTEKLYPVPPLSSSQPHPPSSSQPHPPSSSQPHPQDLMEHSDLHQFPDLSDSSSSSSDDSSSEDSSSESSDSDSEERENPDTTSIETSTLSKDDTLFLPLQASMVTPLKKTPPQLPYTSLNDSNANQSPPAEHLTSFVPQTNLTTQSNGNFHFDSDTMPFMVSPAQVAMTTPSQVPIPFSDTLSIAPISTVTDDLALSSENDSDSESNESESGSSSSDSDDGSHCDDATEALSGEHQLNVSQTNEDLVVFPSPVNSPMCFDEEMGFDPMSQESQVTQLFESLGKDTVPSEAPQTNIAPQEMSTPKNLQPPMGGAVGGASPDPSHQQESAISPEHTGAQASDQGSSDVVGAEVRKRANRDLKRSQLAACSEHPCSQTASKMEKETSPPSGQPLEQLHQVAGKKRKWVEPSVPSTAAPLKAPRLHRYSSVDSTQGEPPSNDGMDSGPMALESDQTLVIKIPLSLVKKKRMATVEPYHVTAPSEKASRRRSEGQESVEEDPSRRRDIPEASDFSRHREDNQYSHEYPRSDDRGHTHRARNWEYSGPRHRHGNTEGRHDYPPWGEHYNSEYWDYGSAHYDRGTRSDYEEGRRSRGYHADRSSYNSKRTLQEARRKKHEADSIKIPGVEKAKAYMEAVTCFMKHGYSMEHDKLQLANLFKLYQDTISMIKHSQLMAGNNQPLLVLCLRCQAVLYMKLYSLKQPAASAVHKELQEYFAPSTKSCVQKSPYPNSFSPIPSPASVGSTASTASTTAVHPQDPSPSSTITIPQHIVSKATEHLTITSYVNHSFELWRQSEQMAEHDLQFFSTLERKAGRIFNGSSLIDVVEWTEQGLRSLR